MEKLAQDLRFAVRSLVRRPGFALTAIVTLALGIGSTTAIFSVVNAVIIRPLPFERADRIVALRNLWTNTGLRSATVSAPDADDWKAQSQSFQSMAYYTGGETSVTMGRTADYVYVFRVMPGFFETLGAHAAIGRLLSDTEQQPGGPLAVVITDAFWRRQFNADPKAIGATVKFGDQIFTVAGVLERGIRFPARADIYAPFWIRPATTSRSAHNYRVIARLKDGVSIDQARAELTTIARRLEAQYPASNANKLDRHRHAAGTAGWRHARHALHAARRRRARPVDRVRERGEPPALARDLTQPRDGGAGRRRRGAGAAGPSAAHRERAPGLSRGASGRVAGAARDARTGGARAGQPAAARRDPRRQHRPAVRDRRGARVEYRLRPGAGAAGLAGRAGRRTAPGRQGIVDRRARRMGPSCVCRRRNRAGRRARGRRRAPGAQPGRAFGRGHGLPA